MAVTKLSDLINAQVMADAISAELPSAIKFAPLATIDTKLTASAGNTITVPKFKYIGDASDVAEGEAIDIATLTASTTQVTVKKAGKGVEITDEAMLSGYGDCESESKDQLKKSIAQKVDNDCITVLNAIPIGMTVDKSIDVLTPLSISDALVKFGEAVDEASVLIIAPIQLATLRTSAEFLKPSELGDKILMTGVIGAIYGCQLIVSNKIVAKDDKYNNFIVKPGAFTIFMKKDVALETDRNITTKTTMITADEHYVVSLGNESKAIKLIVKATPKVA